MKPACIAVFAAMVLANVAWAQTDEEMRKLREAAAKEQEEELKGLPKRVSDLEKKVEAAKVGDKSGMRVYWGPGLMFESGDKAFRIHVGGRIQFEWGIADYGDEDVQLRLGEDHDFEDGFLFRRARINIAGTIYTNVIFMIEVDFATGNEDFKDLYIGYTGIPLEVISPDFIAGRVKEPFGFEELTSSRFITFPERSMVTAAFAPAHAVGFTLRDTVAQADDRIQWAMGVYRHTNQNHDTGAAQGGGAPDVQDGRYDFAIRVTGVPWIEQNGRQVVHIGIAYRTQLPQGNTQFTARPESRIVNFAGQPFGQTPALAARDVDRNQFLGAEFAAVYGPFWMFAEYMMAMVDRESPFDDPCFSGYHIAIGFFATGETRPYKTSSGTFDRPKPLKNLGQDGGLGAIEFAFRISFLDLSSEGIDAQEHWGYNFVINWYLNPSTRVTLSYLLHHSEGAETTPANQNIDFGTFWIKFWIDY